MTKTQLKNVSKKVLRSETFKRKRRNVVRDWLYFIVWYVRLKRILEQHKSTSNGSSIASLLSCNPNSVSNLNAMKSPMQDPTQLTETSFAAGLPIV